MTGPAYDLFGGAPRSGVGHRTAPQDLAASIQSVTEDVMLAMGREVHRQTGLRHLDLAGGVALNCVANGRLLREGPFDDIWIQPAAGDAGGALGAALFVWHQLLDKPRKTSGADAQKEVCCPRYSTAEIRMAQRTVREHRRHMRGLLIRSSEMLGRETSAGFGAGWNSAPGYWRPQHLGDPDRAGCKRR
jgi:carbamoyltransferase